MLISCLNYHWAKSVKPFNYFGNTEVTALIAKGIAAP